uniref:Uncharacterized protein n=1 Tax=Lepeophtheirus salmonis TaxID=72036 RepID=A0A0K2VDP3_LEPSM
MNQRYAIITFDKKNKIRECISFFKDLRLQEPKDISDLMPSHSISFVNSFLCKSLQSFFTKSQKLVLDFFI